MTHATGRPHEMTPEQAIAWRVAVLPILRRLCQLQEEVVVRHLGQDDANDCFCGLGGFWPNPEEFRSHTTAVEFIEETVRARLEELERLREQS